MVISDPLLKHELKMKAELTDFQREIICQAAAGGGVIFRYKLKRHPHPGLQIGVHSYPADGLVAPETYQRYNDEVCALREKGFFGMKSDCYIFSWAGWRIARTL